MIDGMRTGFVRDSEGNSLLPITHINLIIGDDGTSIRNTFDALDGKIKTVGSRLSSVSTYDDLLKMDTSTLIDGAIAYVINDKTYYSYTSGVWELMTTGGSGGTPDYENDIYSHIWIGPNPPENRNMIWIDTNNDGIMDSDNDYKTLITLLEKVAEMEVEIATLKGRIEYLEENGVVVPGPGDPDDPDYPDIPDDPTYDEDDIVLLEDGTELLLEDGTELLLEEQIVDDPPVVVEYDAILLENGLELLFEDGSSMMLETQTPTVKPVAEKVLLFENNTEILLENGNQLLLER